MALSLPGLPSARRYNLTTCHDPAFVWFRVAKTGTRTFLELLNERGLHLDAEHPMNVHYPVSSYRDHFKFAFVRNPWDRLVSSWRNKVVDQNWWKLSAERRDHLLDFSNFVAYVSTLDVARCDVHLRSQSSVIDLNNLDYLARFESFDVEVRAILARLGLEVDEIPHRNASVEDRSYREYYVDGLADQVGSLYRKDAQLFRYDF
ncbi:MAG: sulfotransferase family 2 domain-containing protein [Longimicrobiales bacterium]